MLLTGNIMTSLFRISTAILLCITSLQASSGQVSKEKIKGLDEQVQDIKKDVLEISTELSLLEEKLLFPSNTQVSLFISLAANENLELDAVEVEVDGKSVSHHIYTYKELLALREGGMQRIYTGNVRTGEHQLRVGFRGKTALGNKFFEVENYKFMKGVGPGLVEIKLVGSAIGAGNIEFFDR